LQVGRNFIVDIKTGNAKPGVFNFPPLRSCGSKFFAVLIGTQKPIPFDDGSIAVFIPITSPVS